MLICIVAKNVLQYSKTLHTMCTCAFIKNSNQHAHEPLQLLLVPPAQFYSYTLDFFTDLPPASDFKCVLTVIDHLTKVMYLIPCTMGEGKL